MTQFLDRSAHTQPPHYTQLLIVMVLRLLVTPLLQGGPGNIVASFFFFYIIFLIVQSYRLRRTAFLLFVAIATLGFGLDVVLALGLISVSAVTLTILTIELIYGLFFGSATLLILRDLWRTRLVTMDTVRGGICVYLLLGYLWVVLYVAVETFDPQAFSSPLLVDSAATKVVYYSFVTLTTLGFGDISPVSSMASTLTILEALVGQLYPTIFIGLLVGSYLSNQNSADD
ncbi:MAG: two pore domain potassium channel family protein [Cyanothece sp. SIO2G6]|nr:two pore domain potassium channel family protein [Cyanothece sp. SIO2G6]